MAMEGWTVAIVDDDENAILPLWNGLEDANFKPLIIKADLLDADKIAALIQQTAQAAICDNRLSHRGTANFYGAELVARCYERRVPALLVTQFQGPDQNLSIRKFRDKIPLVFDRGEADAIAIRDGLRFCSDEIAGIVDPTRQGWRTLVRIEAVDFEGGERVVDVIVPGWDQNRGIRFPTSTMPDEISELLPTERKENLGIRIFAVVNVGASDYRDIYFRQFEVAPALEDKDGLA